MNIIYSSIKLKRLIFTTILILGLFTPLLLASDASAQAFNNAKEAACQGVNTGAGGSCADGPRALGAIVERVLDLISVVVGVICVIVIIISGFRYVTSAGNSEKLTSARNTFIYALIGLILVAFAQLIVKLVLSRIVD